MAEYTLSFVDERPTLDVTLNEQTLTYTDAGIQGPQGPAGDSLVIVSATAPVNPLPNQVWVKPV